ncbi:MAG: VWA domain-containing protein [Nitrospirae bacterium]|nr:VWA domain-containing protein [Nitrospirota bacterium]MBF0533853.1 VWA domain-containing protein [Nitrospirota bacterium]MBF0615438.1 VWA domain-containing protein [Nitrospirota bacterium]
MDFIKHFLIFKTHPISDFMFKDPIVLILIPLLVALLIIKERKTSVPSVRFSTLTLFAGITPAFRTIAVKYIVILRIIAVILLCLALARPQQRLDMTTVETKGIDIALAVDLSTSMFAEDFSIKGKRQNRLDAVKEVVRDFIKNRNGDRIAMVAFASRPYTASPLTTDYTYLLENMDRLKIGMIEDGTAIGNALAAAVNRVKDTKSLSKVVILLTDGINNTGTISPMMAAEAARALNIKVYTVGAGSKGPVPYPMKDPFGNTVYQQIRSDVDDETLTAIAKLTGGQYFRATDFASLKKIYTEIDKLEKTSFEEKRFFDYKEYFHFFLIPALFLLLLEVLLKNTFLRTMP